MLNNNEKQPKQFLVAPVNQLKLMITISNIETFVLKDTLEKVFLFSMGIFRALYLYC